jgi:hypothetical protein
MIRIYKRMRNQYTRSLVKWTLSFWDGSKREWFFGHFFAEISRLANLFDIYFNRNRIDSPIPFEIVS